MFPTNQMLGTALTRLPVAFYDFVRASRGRVAPSEISHTWATVSGQLSCMETSNIAMIDDGNDLMYAVHLSVTGMMCQKSCGTWKMYC
jgi:hypothetical protein